MKSRASLTSTRTARHSFPGIVRTGAHCPVAGFWRPQGRADAKQVFVSEGSLMPAIDGRPVVWILSSGQGRGQAASDSEAGR